MGDDAVTTNVRLERGVYLRMKELAAQESRSLSDVLREASAEYVARREGAIPEAAVRDDPFFRFLAKVDEEQAAGQRDSAQAHDLYLYGPDQSAARSKRHRGDSR